MIKKKLLERLETLLDGPLTLDKAIVIATLAHAGQEDKGRNSYIRHPLRVAEKMDSEDEMICAVCHDVVEDTFISLRDLAELGFTQSQLKTIDSLTKKEGETYDQRIDKITHSYVARKIKTADIMDNSQLWRLKSRKLTEKDMVRQQNYIDALTKLGTIDKRDK